MNRILRVLIVMQDTVRDTGLPTDMLPLSYRYSAQKSSFVKAAKHRIHSSDSLTSYAASASIPPARQSAGSSSTRMSSPSPAQPAQGQQHRGKTAIQDKGELKIVQIAPKEIYQIPIAKRWDRIEQLIGQILRRLHIQPQPRLTDHKQDRGSESRNRILRECGEQHGHSAA